MIKNKGVFVILVVLSVVLLIFQIRYYFYYFQIIDIKTYDLDEASNILIHPSTRKDYRLGDLILLNEKRKVTCGDGWGDRWEHTNQENLAECTIRKWPNSIASIYLTSTMDVSNIKILNDIISLKEMYYTEKPEDDTAVFHLRVGDVIDFDYEKLENDSEKILEPHEYKIPTAVDFWERKTCSFPHRKCPLWSYYVFTKEEMKHRMTKLKMLNLNKVCFVYGVHTTGEFKESKKYIAMCKELFTKNGFTVDLKCDNDADESFIYMCCSKYFIPSRGGFSKLVSKIVKYRSNHVV